VSTAPIDDGGAAFPVPEIIGCLGVPQPASAFGMSLRDYFAGQVLAGWCVSERTLGDHADEVAKTSYKFADAMLRARKAVQP
jgi:hypothetical protein